MNNWLKGLTLAIAIAVPLFAGAAQPTKIHLEEFNGYFAAKETLAGLKPGEYEFVVTNKSGKKVGFELQDLKTQRRLDMFPLDPGESRSSVVKINEGGFRYRCPINPTPWYEVSVGQ
ncbi:MAG: hypothetical protein ACKVQA_24835 [Burkholderiales bacterium]